MKPRKVFRMGGLAVGGVMVALLGLGTSSIADYKDTYQYCAHRCTGKSMGAHIKCILYCSCVYEEGHGDLYCTIKSVTDNPYPDGAITEPGGGSTSLGQVQVPSSQSLAPVPPPTRRFNRSRFQGVMSRGIEPLPAAVIPDPEPPALPAPYPND